MLASLHPAVTCSRHGARRCACYLDQTPSVFDSPATSYEGDQLWIK